MKILKQRKREKMTKADRGIRQSTEEISPQNPTNPSSHSKLATLEKQTLCHIFSPPKKALSIFGELNFPLDHVSAV